MASDAGDAPAIEFRLPLDASVSSCDTQEMSSRVQHAAAATRALAADLTLTRLRQQQQAAEQSPPSLQPLRARRKPGRKTNLLDANGGEPALQQSLLQHRLRETQRENEGLHALNELLVAKAAQGEQRLAELAQQLGQATSQLASARQTRSKLSASRAADQAVHSQLCQVI